MPSLTIQTPSRLHVGLLGWGPHALRQFGGLGLMIDDPGLSIRVESSGSWGSSGPHAGRALEVAQAICTRLTELGQPVGPVAITVDRAPQAHVGLGLGTQLSLALAKVFSHMAGIIDAPVEFLTRLTGRGQRSGIGLHGFQLGGFLIDGGRRADTEAPTLLMQRPFPKEWRILVIVPGAKIGLHGNAESRAFEALVEWPESSTERLCRLVLLGILPALVEKDLPAFGSALREIQREVGSGFARVQGGRYSLPEVEPILQKLAGAGVVGLGQSSWGPTLYGFTQGDAVDRTEVLRIVQKSYPTTPFEIIYTRANQSGAILRET